MEISNGPFNTCAGILYEHYLGELKLQNIKLMLGTYCRSDQLDHARSSNRVLVWLGRFPFPNIFDMSVAKPIEKRAGSDRVSVELKIELIEKQSSWVGLKLFTLPVPDLPDFYSSNIRSQSDLVG